MGIGDWGLGKEGDSEEFHTGADSTDHYRERVP